MKIVTKYHGEIEVNANEVITFQKGIPGFQEENEFTLLPFADDSPFQILQSLKTGTLAFVLVNPFLFISNYEFDIPNQVIENLEIKEQSDVVVFSVITIKESFEETTGNLQAPIIINGKNRRGEQIILNDNRYTTRHTLFKQQTSIGQEG
jgi:flagellar assembly factor FliW